MIGRRCHCGCRAPLERCNVRSHAKFASRSCKSRAWKRQSTKASTGHTQSQTRPVSSDSLPTASHIYASTHAGAAPLSLSGRERTLDKPQHFPSTASRDAFSLSRINVDLPEKRESVKCRWKDCPGTPKRGFVFCPTHEAAWHADRKAWPAEADNRQFVRWVYRDCPPKDRMPYCPASEEPKRQPRKDKQPPINLVLGRLLGAGCDYRPAQSVDEWQAQCPVHEDSRPSLVVRRNANGSVWLKCWSGGCSKESILAALGLEWRDLWEHSEHDAGRRDGAFVRPLLPPHLRRAMEELLAADDKKRGAA